MDTVILYAIPFFFLTMVAEWRVLTARQAALRAKGYTLKDTLASLSMGIGYLVFNAIVTLATIPLYVWLSNFALWDLSGTWWMWPALLFAEDFCYYWYHRFSHEMRFFWASHVNHHSSRFYNLSTALRQSWTTPLTGWIFWVPLVLVGFPVELILLQKALNLLYQYWIHTESVGRLGPLEWVFNTPSHHRVHHGRNLRYLDRNYGGIFILWDRLFGTFQVEEEDEPVEYGLVHNLETYNPVHIAFHEWVALGKDILREPRATLGYLFRAPGWRPNGESETVKDLLERARQAEAPATASATSDEP